MTFRLPLALLCTGLVLPQIATADETVGAPKELEVVTVTATKTATSYEKVMGSVTAMDAKFIQERGAVNFQELTEYTPNVTITLSGAAAQFVVRGLGTPDTNSGFDPSVGTVVDGVYYGRGYFLSAFFNDIDKFEVLRGPQGTLFGKNSTAGLFNVVTQKPVTKLKFDGMLLSRGYGELNIRPAFTVPVTEKFSLRLSGNFQNGSAGSLYNTFLERPERNAESNSVRLRSRWVGDGGVIVDAQAFTSHIHQNNSGFQLTTLTPEMRDAIIKYDDAFTNDPEARTSSTNYPSAEDTVARGFSTTVEVPLPSFGGIRNLRLTSISAWAESSSKRRDIDADFSPIPFIVAEQALPQLYSQLSQELRFTGSGKDFFGLGYGIDFIAGVYIGKSNFTASDRFTLESFEGAIDYCTASGAGSANCNGMVPGGGGAIAGGLSGPIATLIQAAGPDINNQNVQTLLDQRGDNLAGFGQFDFNFLRDWAVIAGLRYGIENKDAKLMAEASSPIVQRIANSEDHTTPLTREEKDFSPKLGLRYSPNKRFSNYFTWARGFKSGGYNALPLRRTDNEYGPERASSFELGTKIKTKNNKLRFSASIFDTRFKDLQVSTFLNNRFIVLNAAEAESRGGELDLQWLPEIAPFLFIRSSLGYTDARYANYPNGPCYSDAEAGDVDSGGTCKDDGTQDLSGKRLPFGSKWTASITPNVFVPLGNGLLATIGVDWLYRSSRYLDVDIDDRKRQEGTRVWNALISITDESKKWAVTFSGRNLTNTRSYDQRLGQPLAPGNFASFGLSDERSFNQAISYSF